MSNRYEDAARCIPAGGTRSYMELAALAGKPGAARAGGRAVGLVFHLAESVRSRDRRRGPDQGGRGPC